MPKANKMDPITNRRAAFPPRKPSTTTADCTVLAQQKNTDHGQQMLLPHVLVQYNTRQPKNKKNKRVLSPPLPEPVSTTLLVPKGLFSLALARWRSVLFHRQ